MSNSVASKTNFSVAVCENMSENDIYSICSKFDISKEAKLIIIDKNCKTIDKLYTIVGDSLSFPNYFGKNFSALRDCVNDGDIVYYKSMLLLIRDGKNFLADEDSSVLEGLLDVMNLISQEWASGSGWPWFFSSRKCCTVIELNEADCRYDQFQRVDSSQIKI